MLLNSLLHQLRGNLARNARRAQRRKPVPLHFEVLEDRAVPATGPMGFNFVDFSDPSSLSLLGSAAVTPGNVLRLTPAVGGQNGAAWFTADKQFVGLAFESTFQFQMTDNFDSPGGSDGFVFILQNTADRKSTRLNSSH